MTIEADYSFADGASQSDNDGLSGAVTKRRLRAFRQARRHSYLVRALRFVLPLCALASFSLYYLTTEVTKPPVTVEAIKITSEYLTMEKVRWEGYNKSNGKYLVKAESALQSVKNPSDIKLIKINAKVDNPDQKGWTVLESENGRFDAEKEVLQLFDGISLTSSDGMTANLDSAIIDVKEQVIVSNVPVTLNMLNGTVNAKKMMVTASDRKVLFSGGVKVRIYKESNQQQTSSDQ